jgi:hypothetical protein
MTKQGSYYSFPIAYLQGMDTEPTVEQLNDWYDRVSAYSVYHYAVALCRETPEDESHVYDLEDELGVSSDDEDFWPFVASSRLELVPLLSRNDITKRLSSADNLKLQIDAGGKLTRIRLDIMGSLMLQRIDWPDFRVLCAVYACCNAQAAAVRVHRGQLAAMASGFGSTKYLPPDLPDLLKPHQISYRIRKLEQRGFFTSLTAHRRELYVSNCMDYASLSKWVAKRLSDKLRRRASVPTAVEKKKLLNAELAVQVGPEAAKRLNLGLDKEAIGRLRQLQHDRDHAAAMKKLAETQQMIQRRRSSGY